MYFRGKSFPIYDTPVTMLAKLILEPPECATLRAPVVAPNLLK